jgi:hypothetical protein
VVDGNAIVLSRIDSEILEEPGMSGCHRVREVRKEVRFLAVENLVVPYGNKSHEITSADIRHIYTALVSRKITIRKARGNSKSNISYD